MYSRAKTLLKDIYGYSDFRFGQERVIKGILEKRDTLGILPTGGGKSICYQIPAIMARGITIVVSPLISLMKDQVDTLNQLGIASIYLNSSLSKEEYSKAMRDLRAGRIKLVYLAPERLVNKKFLGFITSLDISLLAIDEAHCISQWGHDFRKSYLEIPSFIKALNKRVPIIALTATATSRVRKDIIEKLELRNPSIYVDTFDRPNLKFKIAKGEDPYTYITSYLEKHRRQPGIIYASTRKEVDSIYAYLKMKAFSVGKYHGGLDEKERKEFQDKFLRDRIRVMVATNAFGMGIDKSNVRFVIHRNIPSDIESYYQEAGRAGRDGVSGECILLYNEEDINTQEYFIDSNEETSDKLKIEKHSKLDAMVNYASINTCLREYILKYFGDKRIKNYCGNCQMCQGKEDVVDLTLDAQKVLSLIGRSKGTLGGFTVSKVLLGELDSKIERKGLHNSSTFGIMKEYTKERLDEFINFLISEGYLGQSAGSYPVLRLIPRSYKVLKGEKNIYRRKDEVVSFDYYEDPLFAKLNDLRNDIANREDIAPYIVLSDLTLIEMAERKPKNRWEMLKVRGIGNQKFKNYGEDFLRVINELEGDDLKIARERYQLENKIDERYLTREKINKLRKNLNITISESQLKDILIKSIFKDEL